MTTPSNDHYQQPPLPLGASCCRCERILDQTRGAGWWDGRWWCLACLAKGKRP